MPRNSWLLHVFYLLLSAKTKTQCTVQTFQGSVVSFQALARSSSGVRVPSSSLRPTWEVRGITLSRLRREQPLTVGREQQVLALQILCHTRMVRQPLSESHENVWN